MATLELRLDRTTFLGAVYKTQGVVDRKSTSNVLSHVLVESLADGRVRLVGTDAALHVPVMCNPGTKEGVTVKEGRFAGVWPSNEAFFTAMRNKGALIGVAVDPLTAHECGNQRYLAIPWLDACLSARLPEKAGDPLKAMPTEGAWLATLLLHHLLHQCLRLHHRYPHCLRLQTYLHYLQHHLYLSHFLCCTKCRLFPIVSNLRAHQRTRCFLHQQLLPHHLRHQYRYQLLPQIHYHQFHRYHLLPLHLHISLTLNIFTTSSAAT